MRSKIGRAIVSIRENEATTASLGIHTARYIVLAFVWSGSVVGIAGAMFAVLTERVLPEAFGLTEVIIHFGMVLVEERKYRGSNWCYRSYNASRVLSAVSWFR